MLLKSPEREAQNICRCHKHFWQKREQPWIISRWLLEVPNRANMISRYVSLKLLNRDICRKEESSGHGLAVFIFEQKRERPSARVVLVFGGSKQNKHWLHHLYFGGPQQRYLQKEKVWMNTRERRAHNIRRWHVFWREEKTPLCHISAILIKADQNWDSMYFWEKRTAIRVCRGVLREASQIRHPKSMAMFLDSTE